MNIAQLTKRSELFVGENSAVILTAIGVTGTVTTAVLSGRASVKAYKIIVDSEEAHRSVLEDNNVSLTNKEKFQLVWPCYIPPVGVGAATVSSIILANRISSKKAAALAAAYGLSERAFQEYKEKVLEKVGETKERAVRDEIAQDRVRANPVGKNEIIIAGTGDVLCMDMLSGRYFQSSIEKIRAAENKINREILNHMYSSLSSFYDEIGLPPTMFSNDIGFNTEYHCEVNFSAVLSTDERPCMAISFAQGPVQDYARLYN